MSKNSKLISGERDLTRYAAFDMTITICVILNEETNMNGEDNSPVISNKIKRGGTMMFYE